MLDRLNNLQSEEELNQINNELEPLEQEAKEYERKKEQEEIDNYIKGLISKYNGLIQNASLEELQELTTKLGKICELISKGKSLNKDLKYYQSIETILDEEKTKEEQKQVEKNKISASTSGIYIKLNNRQNTIYLFHKDINKLETMRLNSSLSFGEDDFIDITQEELDKEYISLEDFFIRSKKYKNLSGRLKCEILFRHQNITLEYDDSSFKYRLFSTTLEPVDVIQFVLSPQKIEEIIHRIKKDLERKSKRKQLSRSDEMSKSAHSFWENIDTDRWYRKIFGEPDYNYGDNKTVNGSLRGRGRGGNSDLNF